ncbi:hypothetical protein POJ06DRAFT_279217 [Lipomyces tetrasporus]|uniref:Uncharacterized protein n=1 Tax=Lipomyces tetrasporus TaxID=54092 RepID=A0AAD7VVX5_9ASCO|nr:uncharacterized protein POJ06DRAFT_279217 [Lipomyces tetrasporus]KAJ8103419.1 hypothetical protein POJ06DRAFT_279217 [Lipomyces tetrasporus]
MESSRSASRQQRCARSCPATKIDLQFVNVRPDDQDQRTKTRAIVRANAAHFHWRHNRPPQEKAIVEQSGRGTVFLHDKRRPMNSTQGGPNVNPLPSALVNHCIAFNAEVVLPALFPDGANSSNVRASLIQMSISNPCVLHIFITGALTNSPQGTLGDTPSDRIALDMFRSRAEMVRSLSIAIKDPVEACKDINIFAIVALAKAGKFQKVEEMPLKTPKQGPLKSLQLLNWLALSEIDPIHFDGLSKLIELKGGLEKIEIPGLAALISIAGLLVGTRECTAPRFPVVPLSCLSREFIFHGQGMGFGTDQDLYMVLSMLDSYTIMIDDFCEGRKIVTASSDRLATLIYSLLVTFPLPYSVAPFKYLVTQLRIALTEWDGDDHMLVWVLTMGGIGATGLGKRVWFMKKLQDAAMRIGVRSWIELRDIIKRGLWHEATNDRDGQDLWLESRIAN